MYGGGGGTRDMVATCFAAVHPHSLWYYGISGWLATLARVQSGARISNNGLGGFY